MHGAWAYTACLLTPTYTAVQPIPHTSRQRRALSNNPPCLSPRRSLPRAFISRPRPAYQRLRGLATRLPTRELLRLHLAASPAPAPCHPWSQTHPPCCPPAPLARRTAIPDRAMYVLQPPCTPIIRDRRASRNLRHLPSLAPTCVHVRSRSPWCLHIQAALAARIHTHALERTRARAAAK